MRAWISLIAVAFTLADFGPATSAVAVEPPVPAMVEFNRDVRPILSDNCFHCHGPDQNAREAE
jgi:hypothetical protein